MIVPIVSRRKCKTSRGRFAPTHAHSTATGLTLCGMSLVDGIVRDPDYRIDCGVCALRVRKLRVA